MLIGRGRKLGRAPRVATETLELASCTVGGQTRPRGGRLEASTVLDAAPNFTKHARERMQERKISAAEVVAVLKDHHTVLPDDGRGGQPLIGDVNGRRIKVVVAIGSDPPRIITVGD